ncbi:hypothetical protein Y032_0025g1290 [Ancylostoma ceylanicum]|uniref:Uncharacterized protein n=1 Tax=Ancylostoma ceylanicum TaxID=53326 RepID=A0A016UXS4_9BILA|nr:hypothetical protein Y032_0025g1290 [Ancylostoma ceylanicum]
MTVRVRCAAWQSRRAVLGNARMIDHHCTKGEGKTTQLQKLATASCLRIRISYTFLEIEQWKRLEQQF